MDIMNFLGFRKKGADPQNEPKAENGPGFKFSEKHPRGEKETRIYNLIILDESGSMDSIKRQALSGANETLQSIRAAQKENPDDHQMITFVTFSGWAQRPPVRTLIDTDKIDNVKELSPDQYTPCGNTPLYDAMGLAITAQRELVKEGDHVLVTVITDGLENSSRLYTAEMVKELVESLSSQNWVFTYIGANQHSEQVASTVGIRSAMDFRASAEGSEMMFDKMQSSHWEYYKKVREHKRTGGHFDFAMDFFGEQKAATRVTPDRVDHLEDGQIFVFGSNVENPQ